MSTEQTSEKSTENKKTSSNDPLNQIIRELEKYEESTPRRKSVIDSGE